jgi:DNA polymerase III delta prime subunit
MRFSEKYRPGSLAEIVGQPATRKLAALAADPYACCVLLECEHGGVGKTSAALAFAKEIGCEDEWSGLHVVPCSEFTVDVARKMFDGDGSAPVLRLRPFQGRGWQCLVLEEFDWLPPQTQRYLKVALETKLPAKCVVVATSNGAARLDAALLQRFRIYSFWSGRQLAEACNERLRAIWRTESGGLPVPSELDCWGVMSATQFSMRVALDQMQDHLAMRREVVLAHA